MVFFICEVMPFASNLCVNMDELCECRVENGNFGVVCSSHKMFLSGFL